MSKAEQIKRRRAILNSKGLCGQCANPNDRPSRILCSVCNASAIDRAKKWSVKNNQKSKYFKNRLVSKRREAGLCVRCGLESKKWYCEICTERRNLKSKIRESLPTNRERRNKTRNAYRKKPHRQAFRRFQESLKRSTDLQYTLKHRLRSRLYDALNGRSKSGSAVRDLGCSISDLIQHIQSQFTPGMNWKNYGFGWHIDHKVPLSSVDLTDRAQLLKVCHWSNLQPLWAAENLKKGAKLLGYLKAS